MRYDTGQMERYISFINWPNQKQYKILSNQKICPKFFRLSLDAQPLLKEIQPGQFVHLKVAEGLKPFFRRPFSVFRAQKSLEILYEVVGPGTTLLSRRKKNDLLDCVGPLGTPFSLPPRGIKQVVLIAGGVGVAPFLLLTLFLVLWGFTKRIGCNINSESTQNAPTNHFFG